MKIIAHTGCMGTKMNSRESILAGIQERADYIEVDVRFLKGRAVLTHDRPEPGKDYVLLEEAVRLVQKTETVRLALDLKEWDRIGEVAAVLEQYDMLDRSVYLGNFMEDMDAMVKWGKGVACFPNVYPEQAAGLDENGRNSLADRVKKLGARAVGMNYRAVTPELIQNFHERGIMLSAWTVEEEMDMKRLMDWGADFITSDRPDLVRNIWERYFSGVSDK